MGLALHAIDGVIRHETTAEDLLTVTFDDEKTSSEKIQQALTREGLASQGEPVYYQ